MKLKHWKQLALSRNSSITRAVRQSYGTVTATPLADYPIDDQHRRCVIRIISNNDYIMNREWHTAGCEDYSLDLVVEWLFNNGKRFTAVPVDRKAFTRCHSFDIYKPTPVRSYERVLHTDYESIYEAEYKCAAQSTDEKNDKKPHTKIRNMDNTSTVEVECLTDYQRGDYVNYAIRQCIISVKGDGADAIENIDQIKGVTAASDAMYDWLLDKGKRFVKYPINIGDISNLVGYRDPNDPKRMVYCLTYLWEDMPAPPFAASDLRERLF